MPKQKNTTSEQIAELQKKITLLEGDKKAFYQTSQFQMRKNDQKISALRKENKELHQKYASSLTCDEEAINETLTGEEKRDERVALRNKSTSDAIKIMNNKKCDALKRLNRQKYKTEEMKKKVEEMNKRHEQVHEDQNRAKEAEEGDSESGRRKRELENSGKKAEMKIQEAENISLAYNKILHQLEQEKLTYGTQFDEIKEEIECNKEELRKLKEMQCDAENSRDAAKNQLQKQDEKLKREKKEREEKLKELRKQAEEKKQLHDKMDRKNRSAAANANANAQDQDSSQASGADRGEESERKIQNYQEAFLRIKEATGVDDVDEVVERFRNQEDTYLNLEEQKKKNADALDTLQAEKKTCSERKTNTRYNCETKGSHGEKILEEAHSQLEKECERKENSEEKERLLTRYYIDACSSVEHLDIKLKHCKCTKSQEPKRTPNAEDEDYVLDVLMDVEDKLQKLLEDLGDKKNFEDIEKEVVEGGAQSGATTTADYHHLFEDSLPQYNTRVVIPTTNKEQTTVYDEVDSGEDEECLTREQLKKRSDDLVNSKTKRKPQKKKKKGVK